jgi:hypothetical protein
MRQFLKPIFCGNGSYSAFQIEALKDRVESGVSVLSGMQQSGLQGTKPDSDYEVSIDEKHLRDVIEDVAAALGFQVELKGRLDHDVRLQNMAHADPDDQYVVKAFSRDKNTWTTLNEFYWGASKLHMPKELASRLPWSSPRMNHETATMLLNHLTKNQTANTVGHDCDICYAIFPCNSLERPRKEGAFEVKLMFEGQNAEKIKMAELQGLIEKAISYYIEEMDGGDGTFAEFHLDEFRFDVKVKETEAQNAQVQHGSVGGI